MPPILVKVNVNRPDNLVGLTSHTGDINNKLLILIFGPILKIRRRGGGRQYIKLWLPIKCVLYL